MKALVTIINSRNWQIIDSILSYRPIDTWWHMLPSGVARDSEALKSFTSISTVTLLIKLKFKMHHKIWNYTINKKV